MNIDIVGKNVEINENMRSIVTKHLESKINPLLVNFSEYTKNVELSIGYFDKDKLYTISFNFWLPGKENIYAEASNTEFLNAVVELREKVESQIKKYIQQLDENQS